MELEISRVRCLSQDVSILPDRIWCSWLMRMLFMSISVSPTSLLRRFGPPLHRILDRCKTMLAGLPDRTGIELFLLVDNLETVVSAAAQSLGRLTPVKEHTERDRVLGAMLDPSRSSQRSQVVAQVAMLDDIVTHLSTVISVQNAHS